MTEEGDIDMHGMVLSQHQISNWHTSVKSELALSGTQSLRLSGKLLWNCRKQSTWKKRHLCFSVNKHEMILRWTCKRWSINVVDFERGRSRWFQESTRKWLLTFNAVASWCDATRSHVICAALLAGLSRYTLTVCMFKRVHICMYLDCIIFSWIHPHVHFESRSVWCIWRSACSKECILWSCCSTTSKTTPNTDLHGCICVCMCMYHVCICVYVYVYCMYCYVSVCIMCISILH